MDETPRFFCFFFFKQAAGTRTAPIVNAQISAEYISSLLGFFFLDYHNKSASGPTSTHKKLINAAVAQQQAAQTEGKHVAVLKAAEAMKTAEGRWRFIHRS